MDLGVKGRVAIVCAASQGLGKAAAEAFLREGSHVVMCSRDGRRIRAAARELRGRAGKRGGTALPVVADLTKPADIRRLVATAVRRFRRIDILVTNAGGPPVAQFPDLDDSRWEEGITLNLMSTIRCIRAVLPHMRQQRWGRIINITSIAARQPIPDLVISSTVRPGILGLSKVLATQLARENVLVNSVCPGYILTARQREIGTSRAAKLGITYEEYVKQLVREVPAERYGLPEELASVIAFLGSERASYVTGAVVSVDGGLSRGLL